MKFDAEYLPYLQGKKFSNSLKVQYSYFQAIPERVPFLVQLTKNKNVVHLGCLDHQPLIDDKIARKQWLHKELTENCKECIGIDVDQPTKDFVSNKYGFNNIIISDFTKEALPQITQKQWEYAVLGELLEHIDNPVAFLTSIKKNYSGYIKQIVITVPNAWTRTTMRMADQSIEIINSDHRYWFTPYTLSKVMFHAGINTEEIYFTNRVPLTKTELVKKKLLAMAGQEPKYNFTYASSLVAIGTL
jgi:hypothetical protein